MARPPRAKTAPALHPGAVATATPSSVNISGAASVEPPATGVTSTVEPLAAAGLELAKIVLAFTAGSIIILTLILAAMELGAAWQAARASERALAIATLGRTAPQDGRLELLAAELRRAHDDPAWKLPEASEAEASALVKELGADANLSQAQRDLVVTCIPLPAPGAAKREEALAQCAGLVDQLLAARQSPGERLKFLADLQKQSDDQRQAFRAFWLQVAQLILMNLFFPLLTALLGYIFGTQARKTA